jgi:hypothetical protein
MKHLPELHQLRNDVTVQMYFVTATMFYKLLQSLVRAIVLPISQFLLLKGRHL